MKDARSSVCCIRDAYEHWLPASGDVNSRVSGKSPARGNVARTWSDDEFTPELFEVSLLTGECRVL